MKANKEMNWLFGGGSSSSGSNVDALAKEYTDRWKTELEKAGGFYDDAYDSIDGIDALSDKFGQQFDQFQATYTPYRDLLLEMSSADSGRREELAGQFMQLVKPDYSGAANRATADVASQSEIARNTVKRDASRYGVSGEGMTAALASTAMNEAKNKVLASSSAQQAEKTRALQMTGQGIQMFDPTKPINAAVGIDNAGNNLLAGQLKATVAGTEMRTGIASGWAKDIAAPIGDAAGAFQGMSLTKKLSDENASPATGMTGGASPWASSGNYIPSGQGW